MSESSSIFRHILSLADSSDPQERAIGKILAMISGAVCNGSGQTANETGGFSEHTITMQLIERRIRRLVDSAVEPQ